MTQVTAIGPARGALGLKQFAVVATILGALISPVLMTHAWPLAMEEYLMVVKIPPFEAAFGFKADYVMLKQSSGERVRTFQITEVERGGPLDRAGFLPGDLPSMDVCTNGGDFAKVDDFLSHLGLVLEGTTVEFRVGRHDATGFHHDRAVTLKPERSRKQ